VATNCPLVKLKPPPKFPDLGTKTHFEQNFPPLGICRTKFVKSGGSLPAKPLSELGIAAGTHAENVEVGFFGKVKLPKIVAEKSGLLLKLIVSGSKLCPPIVTLPNPERKIWPMSRGGEDPGAKRMLGSHQEKQGIPPKPVMLVPGPLNLKFTLSPEPSFGKTEIVAWVILKETLSAKAHCTARMTSVAITKREPFMGHLFCECESGPTWSYSIACPERVVPLEIRSKRHTPRRQFATLCLGIKSVNTGKCVRVNEVSAGTVFTVQIRQIVLPPAVRGNKSGGLACVNCLQQKKASRILRIKPGAPRFRAVPPPSDCFQNSLHLAPAPHRCQLPLCQKNLTFQKLAALRLLLHGCVAYRTYT